MTTTCGIYCRISKDRQAEGLGVARQEQDARALAERKGWAVAEVYVDNDITATRKGGKVKYRPAFEQLRDALMARQITAVVGWDFDRLFRDPLEQEQFFLLCEQIGGVRVATIGDDVDIDSGYGLLVARIKGAVAAEEARKISERSRRKHLQLAQTGGFHGGGTRPFGFHDDRTTIHAEEAALIRQAAERILAGEPLRSVCAAWNAADVLTVTGQPWSTTVLRRVLTAGRTAGWREHRGTLVTQATWPAIIDRPTLDRLRALLLDPARRVNGNPRRYLLTGIGVCGLCGARLVARPRDDKRRCYVCASGPGFGGCGKIRVLADPLEDYVTGRVILRIDSPSFAKAAGAADMSVDPLLAALADVETQLEQAGRDFYAERTLTREAFLGAQRALTARQAALRAEVGRVERQTRTAALAGTGAGLADRWEGMGFDARRAVVVSVVAQVVVGPAVRGLNRFDRRRVKVRWA
jgi:site-specific DNA recombinase